MVASPLDKEKKLQLPKLADSPAVKKTINEEATQNSLVTQELNLKITALAEAFSGSFNEVATKFQDYDKQIKDSNEKITGLGQAIGILNDEFTKFVEIWQKKMATIPTSLDSNTPPGTNLVTSKRVDLEKDPPAETTPPSTQDKLFQWANLLASLASPGQPAAAAGGGGMGTATDLLQLVLKLQDNAEERALKRTESSIKNIAAIANLLMGKKVELPMESTESTKLEVAKHLL